MTTYTKTSHSQRGTMSAEQRERQHADMVFHIRDLYQRNELLQKRLDESQARIAKLMRETFK
jgi:hypothetical protein